MVIGQSLPFRWRAKLADKVTVMQGDGLGWSCAKYRSARLADADLIANPIMPTRSGGLGIELEWAAACLRDSAGRWWLGNAF